jgi:GNAT superfamily N-acetyltransferase
VNVRRAQRSDLASLLPLVEAFCAVDEHTYDVTRVADALTPLLDGDDLGAVFVAANEAGNPVGYAVVTWSYSLESGGRDCILDEIYVEPRDEGIGSQLLAVVLDASRRAGAKAMFLETEEHNARVRAFYDRHGFRIEPSVWMSRPL